MKIRTRF